MKTNNVEVEILIKGRPVRVLPFNGKMYIEARYDSEYEIKIRNDNYHRVMAVISVDGLSVIDGKPASKDGVGYVLNGYSSASIKGFRKDQDTVGAFKFTKKRKGYAKEVTGSAENSGVIAIAVFAEKIVYPNWTYTTIYNNNGTVWGTNATTTTGSIKETPRGTITFNCASGLVGRATSDSYAKVSNTASYCGVLRSFGACGQSAGQNSVNFCSAQSETKSTPDFNAATTWGTKLQDRVVNTTFEKASSTPMAEFNIYYDIRQNLEKIGIVFEAQKQVSIPNPFPKDYNYAQPPAGWKS